MKTVFETLLKYLAALGLFFTIYSYFDKVNRDERRAQGEQSITYINRYINGDVNQAIKAVAQFWKQNVPAIVRQDSNASTQDMIRTFQYLIKPNPQYAVYESNTNTILLHFDIVAYCAEESLCDQSLINSFYCGQYKSLRAIFKSTLPYHVTEGIDVGFRAGTYFDAKCI